MILTREERRHMLERSRWLTITANGRYRDPNSFLNHLNDWALGVVLVTLVGGAVFYYLKYDIIDTLHQISKLAQ